MMKLTSFYYFYPKNIKSCVDNTMNKPSTDLYGTESNESSGFPIAPDVISDSGNTISASVNRT